MSDSLRSPVRSELNPETGKIEYHWNQQVFRNKLVADAARTKALEEQGVTESNVETSSRKVRPIWIEEESPRTYRDAQPAVPEGSLVQVAGWLLTIGGIAMIALGFSLDPSVEVPKLPSLESFGVAMPDRVPNIQKMIINLHLIISGSAAAVAGVVMLVGDRIVRALRGSR